MSTVSRLSRIEMISADPGRLAAFYRSLGFSGTKSTKGAPDLSARVAQWLGDQRVDLVAPTLVGAPYPSSVPGWSPYFQHIAIVVADMAGAYAKLRDQAGWRAISTNGPERLPDASGGVTAFKFHDPEGHPVELIWFEPERAPARWRHAGGGRLFLGIDHSAISVADTARSAAFYEKLGLRKTGGSLNVGAEQARLDDVPTPRVEVTALAPAGQATPHLELLAYRGDYSRPTKPLGLEDIAATRLVFETRQAGTLTPGSAMWDPDGHLLVLEDGETTTDSGQPPVAKPG